jgi:hypothetical protein
MITVRARHLFKALLGSLLAVAVLLGLSAATPALAAGPWWQLESRPAPTNLPPGGEGQIVIAASNIGNAESTAPLTLSDTLPAGLEATEIKGQTNFPERHPLECALETLTCKYTQGVPPFERLEAIIKVKVSPSAKSGEANTVHLQEGANTPLSLSRAITVSSEATPFAVENFELKPEEEGGVLTTQAGAHPYQLTTIFDLNQTLEPGPIPIEGLFPHAPALTKDLHFHIPPGLLGNPVATARCSSVDFTTLTPNGLTNLCPDNSVIGVAVVTVFEPVVFKFQTLAVPLVNLAPAPGEPARFGFNVEKVPVILDTAVLSGEEYAVEVSVTNATQLAEIVGSQVTFWGEPLAKSHDNARNWGCLRLPPLSSGEERKCTPPAEHSNNAFLTLPTSCSGKALEASVVGDSWPNSKAAQGEALPRYSTLIANGNPLGGCSQLPFGPSIGVEVDQHSASTPTGMTVDVKVPQETTVVGGGLAESAVKATTVTLPPGVQLNPGAANGLLACSGIGVGLKPGFPESLQVENNGFNEELPVCPDQAKVATVKIHTPLLDHELEGAAYLATQNTSPFAPPLVLYLLVHDPVAGVLVKLAGTVTPDPNTGQISSTFSNTPQLPFDELKLHFFDGPRASVSTPPACGSYATQAFFTPWSGGSVAPSSASFEVTSGAEGTACSQPLPPAFNAQSENVQAAAFTHFKLNLAKPDADEPLRELTVHLPTGLAAVLKNVTLCPEPQASQGACPADSLIGKTTTSSGLGPEPFTLPGSVYLTGPYNGAPFGLTIVTPAVAGPFNLGNVIVRSGIYVDPYTAAVTIKTPVPQFVETAQIAAATGNAKAGVPVQLKQTNVAVERDNFQFNPTSCTPKSIDATLTGVGGQTLAVASPFQVANCNRLPFKPGFEAEVTGQGSKPNGVTLKVISTSAGLGQGGIAKVFVALPIQLPSRLSTIQKACRDFQFDKNPVSGCPPDSNIGTATIRTPVFKNPLSGPAYLVSHGNASFPDVEFVLQGEGVTIILDGKTDIKKGITYSRFESLPDAPFTRFETTLPAGPHSALTANVPESKHFNLCGQKLTMPTEIYGQNGVLIKQTTKIKITGCKAPPKRCTTRSCKLKAALKKCHKLKGRKNRKKRIACERAARKKYGAKKVNKKHKRR